MKQQGKKEQEIQRKKKVQGHNLPADVVPFFLVTQPVVFPKEPKLELFASFTFPCVHDKMNKHGSWRDAQKIITEFNKTLNSQLLKDFHFLLWISNNIDNEEVVTRLLNGLKQNENVEPIVAEIQKIGDLAFPYSTPIQQEKFETKKDDPIAQIVQSQLKSRANVEHKTTLMVMFGCTEQRAEEALIATDNNIDAAANLILSDI